MRVCLRQGEVSMHFFSQTEHNAGLSQTSGHLIVCLSQTSGHHACLSRRNEHALRAFVLAEQSVGVHGSSNAL